MSASYSNSKTSTVFKFSIAYHGKNYFGFQRQKSHNSVQSEIESALLKITGEEIAIHPSGRTDTGVHAKNQACHLYARTEKAIKRLSHEKILYKLNSILPDDIRILEFKKTTQKFHSRKSSKSKTYVYHILLAEYPNPFLNDFVWHISYKLNIDKMKKAAEYLLGHHDFSSFCASDSNVITKDRTLLDINFSNLCPATAFKLPKEKYLNITVTGKGFLKQMVRIIVGTLIDIGREKYPPSEIKNILSAKDRKRAGKTAPAQGLFLKNVNY